MTDKNNVEIKAGDIVEITGAYFKHDNALYFVEHIPGDPGWNGGDICLHMIGKSGKLSSTKYSTCFWPLKAYVNDREKAARANLWNSEHAQIEVRTDINQSFVAGWFRKAADDLSVTIEWYKLHFGEDCQDVKRELKTEAHLLAVAARLSGNVRSLHFIGTDDLSREVFVDELGTVWKYTEPGSMPRERHDKLYAASSNDRDGEPGLPMSDAFDYQIIYEGQEV